MKLSERQNSIKYKAFLCILCIWKCKEFHHSNTPRQYSLLFTNVTSSPKGNDAHLRAIIQREKKWKHQFFRCVRAANSVVCGRIWPNFKLIQCSYCMSSLPVSMKGSNQEQLRKSDKTVFQIITLSVAMETSGRIWLNFKLIQAFMHVFIACKCEKDQMKNSGENVMKTFSQL